MGEPNAFQHFRLGESSELVLLPEYPVDLRHRPRGPETRGPYTYSIQRARSYPPGHTIFENLLKFSELLGV